jgi:hypothetical protein
MKERRRVARNRTLKSGRISVNARTSMIDCTIRNLSPNGALLLVPTFPIVPDQFVLQFASDDSRRACRVIWRGENRIGVEFA